MQVTGRRLLGAPVCTTVAGVSVQGAVAGLIHASGDTTVATATAAAATTIPVAEQRGIIAGTSVYLGYGLPTQELVTVSAAAGATGAGNLTTSAAVFAHAVGERVVRYYANVPLRPGSVVVKGINGSTSTTSATDDGKGVLVDAGSGDTVASGTVDYNTGTIRITFSGSATRTVTYNADVMQDKKDLDELTGTGFMHNFEVQTLSEGKDSPNFCRISNLSDATVGIFWEQSKNGGKTWTQMPGGLQRQLAAFQKAFIDLPAVADLAGTRIRLGSASGGAASQVDFDFGYDTSTNGQ